MAKNSRFRIFPAWGERKRITMNQSLFANIPQEMKERAQWINWKKTERDGKKPLKMPIDPKTGTAARTNDPTTWGTFEEAVNAAPRFSGIGYVFTENDPYTGIDLDDVLDDEGNILYDDAKDIINAADSYTEISQSGHGIHIIGHCKLEAGEAGRKAASGDKCEKEIYDRNRYFIFTGNIYDNLFYLHDITETAREIIREIKGGSQASAATQTAEPQIITPTYKNEMTRDEARAYIVEHWGDILRAWTGTAKKKIRGNETFICPHCGHGKGGDGITNTITRPDILKCFSCDFTGDILQLWENEKHVDYITALNELAALLGITIKANMPVSDEFTITFIGDELGNEARAKQEKAEKITTISNSSQAAPVQYGESTNHIKYYKECYARIQNPAYNERAVSYLKSRGISLKTALLHGIGYDPTADPANAPGALEGQGKPHPAARLIIPCDKGYYATRAIDEEHTPREYWKMQSKSNGNGRKTRHINIPNEAYTAEHLFICEGIFDAMSITEAGNGAAAIALNSASHAGELIEAFEKKRPAGVVMLALDTDEAGKAAAERIKNGLNMLTIPYVEADICGECKDPNEALVKDAAAFADAIQTAKEKAARPDGIAAYLNDGGYDRDIANEIPPISTGIEALDQAACGGIRTELYVLSAPSSIGKTTFCLQLACNLATAGRDVLYFAMEQSRLELVNKCIARESYGINRAQAVTAMEAGNPPTWKAGTVKKSREALAAKVGNRLNIIEWNLDATTEKLKEYIINFIERNKKQNAENTPPIVFIDYLQLIQGIEINGRTQQIREVMNNTISEMKKISRSEHIPIICIASQARDKYDKPFEMGNIKESGNIEYTAGVVWGLQYEDVQFPQTKRITDKKGNIQYIQDPPDLSKLKQETPRRIVLVCDKDRGNIGHYQVFFDYYSKHDCFEEAANQATSGFNMRL